MNNRDIKKYVDKIDGILYKDYDHEIPDKPRSVDYNRVIRNMLKKMFPNATIHATKNAWCEASGFIEQDGKFVYYGFGDYRWGDWKRGILIRAAKSLEDYTGGANNITDIYRMEDDVQWLLTLGNR